MSGFIGFFLVFVFGSVNEMWAGEYQISGRAVDGFWIGF
jgi:hypothetical protein